MRGPSTYGSAPVPVPAGTGRRKIGSRGRKAAGAVVLAAALSVAGLLAPWDGGDDASTVAHSPAALFGPAADASRLDATIDTLQERLRHAPDDWRAYADLGLAYVQKSRITADPNYYSRADAALKESIAINSADNFFGFLGMGGLALGRHDFDGALEWGKRAKVLNPYSAQARAVIGDAYVELGRYEAARHAFQKMIDLRPELASYARVSYFRELNGDVDGAIVAMERAVDAAGGSPEDTAWAGYQLGQLYYNSGEIGAAHEEFARAAYVAPDYFLPKVGLARVAAAEGRLNKAITLLSGVLATYPAPEYVILLGDVQALAGNDAAAARQYELVRAIQGLYANNGVNTDLESSLFSADHGIGLKQALAKARAEYARRQSIHVADVLAWTLYASGRYADARHYSDEALRLGTRDALLEYHAGMIALRLGRDSEARRHLSAAGDINPHFSFLHAASARRALKRLNERA